MSILGRMKWIKSAECSQFQLAESVMTMGNFDGLHLGHRAIVAYLVEKSKKTGIPSVVIGFDPHPRKVLNPQDLNLPLFSKRDLVRQLTELKIDYYLEIPFSLDLAQMSASLFFESCIVNKVHPKVFAVGHDFAFGRDRGGGTDYLVSAAKRFGFLFKKFEAIRHGEEIISSSFIRELLRLGNLSEVKKLLGRDYYIEGKVVRGSQRGRQIGFPTANISQPLHFHMARGVYKTILECDGEEHLGVTNIGTRPTVDDSENIFVETYVIGKSLDFYEKSIRIYFKKYLRPEIKFSSLQNLKEQIQADIAQVLRTP